MAWVAGFRWFRARAELLFTTEGTENCNRFGGCVERDSVSHAVIGAAIAVHRAMGPGLLESVYQACLVFELRRREVPFAQGVSVPLVYAGQALDAKLRLDVVVADQLVLELKSIEKLSPIHTAQLLTYLKLTGHRKGLLINFNVLQLKDGLIRLVL
ncbi:MAG: GxxExxY protein [Gemmatimonadaceae bacterium]|nr:GxxExxY protein [Gemmatimonadaceae bacterium]MCW5827185.1 GxxExxY protein [Gemmatimonadaceae bacterium]